MGTETSGYLRLSKAFEEAQKADTPVIRLDDNPQNIVAELELKFNSFKDFPNEKKPKVMIVNLLNVSKNPGTGFHPIALGYLMSAVKSLDPQGTYKDGQENNLLYYNEYQHLQGERTDENFLKEVKKFTPDMILFTVTTSQTKRVDKAIRLMKSEGIKSLTVVGGVDATIQPKVCLERTGADIAIVGEGPIPVKMLVAGWRDPAFPLRLIPGLVVSEPIVSDPNDTVTHYGKPVYFEDLDKYDTPKVPLTDEEKKNGWEMTITRAVGCPYNCPFCGALAINMETTGHRAVRMKSEKAMLEEIEYGLQNNVKSIYFADDTLFFEQKKTANFLIKFKELQQKYSKDGKIIPWAASSRIGEINRHPELLQLAVDAGCVEVEVGKESGSDRLIQKVKPVHNFNKDLMELMDHLKEFPRLKLGINFIIGLPGATFEDELETIKLAADILDRKQPVAFHIHRFVPLPGTDYWDHPENHGLTFDKEAVMDHLSTYGVEDFIESKSLPHNQVVFVDEILNTVLRAKGAVSFRSPYLAALTAEEQIDVSTFVTPGESAREIQQASLAAARREIDKYRGILNRHIGEGSLADVVRVFESRERYVLSMEELLRLADRVINQRYMLPEFVLRESTPEKEANKDLNWYLQHMFMIRHSQRLRTRNRLQRDFLNNNIRDIDGMRIPMLDLSQFERALIYWKLKQLSGIKTKFILPMSKWNKKSKIHDTEAHEIIDLDRRKNFQEQLFSGEIIQIAQQYSQALLKRLEIISNNNMLGGHDFTIIDHILHMQNKFFEVARENSASEDALLIGGTAALLHDIGKLGGNDDFLHPLRSAVIARKILDEIDCFTQEEKKRILALVEHHALIGNLAIHGERNEYRKDDAIRVRGREYSRDRLYAIGPITDSQYIKYSLASFRNHPEDLDILLHLQIADTFAVKSDGSFLTPDIIENFNKTYQRLKTILQNNNFLH